jgi:hypothetical protein
MVGSSEEFTLFFTWFQLYIFLFLEHENSSSSGGGSVMNNNALNVVNTKVCKKNVNK